MTLCCLANSLQSLTWFSYVNHPYYTFPPEVKSGAGRTALHPCHNPRTGNGFQSPARISETSKDAVGHLNRRHHVHVRRVLRPQGRPFPGRRLRLGERTERRPRTARWRQVPPKRQNGDRERFV